MNPILPIQYFIPDAEARDWNGRLYLYGSLDISGDTSYCSARYHVFSSGDLEHWTDHGQSFDLSTSHCPGAGRLYAPDCICRDGQYYLLYCADDGSEGMAVSNKPEGPFGNAVGIRGADRGGIDPAALLDDDGNCYYFWGQFSLKGARMNDRLDALDANSIVTGVLTEEGHGFHEGASIRKRNGIYYLVYTDISRGRATSLAYATSHAPLGPYQKRGIIIDNTGCDPETWNNHGSIAEFNGRWYVFYHRSSHASKFSRRACMEPIAFREDGSIDEVEMTTQGASAPIRATETVDAYRACLLSGKVRSESLHQLDAGEAHLESLTGIHSGDWAAFKYLEFHENVSAFSATLGSPVGGGILEVRCDHQNGPLLCACAAPLTGGWKIWQKVEAKLQLPVTGIHAIYLVFRGGQGRLFDLLDFSFMTDSQTLVR